MHPAPRHPRLCVPERSTENPHRYPRSHFGGPLWALTSVEVYESWLDEPMPFNQIHGHSSPFWFNRGRWQEELSPQARKLGDIDKDRRHVRMNLGGKQIIALDPGLGRRPRGDELHALLLDGTVSPAEGHPRSGAEVPAWRRKWDELG